MKIVAIIQARMGSTRLPGKVMLPLADEHVLLHVINRVTAASAITETVVATSNKKQDDIINRYTSRAGTPVFRGSESDVLGRMFTAAVEADADIVVRVTADCPLVSPEIINIVVKRLREQNAEYVSTKLERTFPRAIGVAAFTMESFSVVNDRSEESYEREHVTTYYHENRAEFDTINITSDEVFDTDKYIDRTDIRVTLDEADDYELLRRVYNGVVWDGILDIKQAIDYIDTHGLKPINDHVDQVTLQEEKTDKRVG